MSQKGRFEPMGVKVMEVLQKIEKTRREEFSELAQEHHRELLVYARALTREDTVAWDVLQEAFVAAWGNMGKFKITRDFAAWMRGIVRNKWLEQLKKNRRQVALDEETLEAIEVEMRAWQELRQDGGADVFVKLEICLSRLPEMLGAAVQSFYYEGNCGEDAAEKLGVQSATLRKRLERARGALRECLNKKIRRKGRR